MTKKKHAKNAAKKKPVKDKAPVEDLSPVKNSATPKNPNRRVVETPKSKKRKPAEDPAPVEDTAMQCSSDEEVEMEDKPRSDSDSGAESDAETETETVAVKAHSSASQKRKNPNEGGDEEEEKKMVKKTHLFQKLWKDEDELVVLRGMLEFKTDQGKSPNEDMEGFYRFVEESISYEVRSFKQLSNKISRMKNKYMCIGKSFSSDHDLKCLELAKLIWATDALVKKSKESEKSKKKKKKMEEDKEEVFDKSFLIRAISGLGVEKEESLMRRWGMVSVKKRKKIEDTLKTLEAEEFQVATRKAKVLFEAMAEMDKASS